MKSCGSVAVGPIQRERGERPCFFPVTWMDRDHSVSKNETRKYPESETEKGNPSVRKMNDRGEREGRHKRVPFQTAGRINGIPTDLPGMVNGYRGRSFLWNRIAPTI